jgi:VIT1/CCC1 family predicted Fe2+/Mn2+ transporter
VVTGIPDGIMVPFVLVAGLSAATDSISLIMISGIIAVLTGAVTMGLGAYFTTRTESGHFNTDIASKERKERKFLSGLGINKDVQDLASEEIVKENARWSDLMKAQHGTDEARKRGITTAIAYICGGLVPLIPFFIHSEVRSAIKLSILTTFLGLFIFGFIKSRVSGINPWAGTFRILVIAALAAGSAYGVAGLINN